MDSILPPHPSLLPHPQPFSQRTLGEGSRRFSDGMREK
jgi:hypothetical protein